MKKFAKILAVLLVAVFGFVTFYKVSADTTTTALESVTTGSATLMDAYLGDIKISYKTLKDGSIYYCTQFNKDIPASGTKMTKVGPMDSGMTYLIKNGYPNATFTGNDKKDFFITQLAVWWYQDIQTGSNSSVLANLKAGKYDDTEIGKAIIKLKNGALKAKEEGYMKPSMTINVKDVKFDLQNKEYISNDITVNAKGLTGKYTVSLVGAPEGTYIINSVGQQQVKFDGDEKFKVVIPEGNATAKMNFSVKVSGISSVEKSYKYKSADGNVQNIVLGALYQEKKDMSATATFTVTTEEKQEEDETKDPQEETKETTETTTKDVQTEVVTETKVYEEVVEEEVSVPNTASTVSIITYVFGGVIAILGFGLVIRNVKKA